MRNLILAPVLFLCACDQVVKEDATGDCDENSPPIIVSITSTEEGICTYHIVRKKDCWHRQNMWIIDSCGLWLQSIVS